METEFCDLNAVDVRRRFKQVLRGRVQIFLFYKKAFYCAILTKKKIAGGPQKLVYFGLLENISNSTYMSLFKMIIQNKKLAFTMLYGKGVVAFVIRLCYDVL